MDDEIAPDRPTSGARRGEKRVLIGESWRGKPKAKLRELWPFLRDHKGTLVVVAIVSLIATALALVQPLSLQRLVNSLGQDIPLTGLLWLLIAITLGAAIFGALQDYLLRRTAEGVVLGTRRSLVSHLLRLPIAEYDARQVGDLISRVGADTTLLRSVVTSGLFNIVSSILMFFGAIALMALVDVVLLAITLTSVLIGVGSVMAIGVLMRQGSRRAQEAVGAMTASVERTLGAIRTIRASGATERETERVVGAATEAYRAGIQMARLQALIQPIMSVCIQGAFIIVLGVGGYRVATGAMMLGDLIAFLLYVFLLVVPLGQAVGAFTAIQAALAALDRIMEVMKLRPEADDAPTVAATAASDDAPILAFDDVTFAYADGRPVLSGISLSVPRGSRIAIVGPSGAGKSTMLALIERFYEPTGGAILFKGRDVRSMSREELRSHMAYVEQEAPVLAGSIADNLRLGAPAATDRMLMDALRRVGLESIVERSPLGLDAAVGDDGVLLSGGQRQRLAWARALLADTEILLLDEPTSSVDSRTEQILQEALRETARHRTVIVVAHRLATVADSDQIIVVEAGKVVATGTHAELLITSPLYRELASHQLLV
ncbi:MAG: ABC transporter ATP-binding protein [Bauldia sp.]|nr:ABC transporter ATP-binding protein [Bauldia sp.]